MRKPVLAAVAAAGAASLLAQVVLLREILASARGNELILGLVLALWLVLTGAASALGGRLAAERAGEWLARLLGVTPVLLLTSLGFVAWTSSPVAGQESSLLRLVASSLVALLPACALSGLAFAWALSSSRGKVGAGLLYAVETLGAAAAGVAFHFVLADRIASVWILVGGGAACALASVFLSQRRWLAPLAPLLAVVASAVAAPRVERSLIEARFPGEQVLALQPSRYGLLAVVARGDQRAFFHDGELLFTTEDQLVAEERIHLPLLLHPHPRRILLVGGGLGGGLAEALKHAPERLDYVELDPAVLSLARTFADQETRRALASPLVRAVTQDARRLLADSRRLYDVIVIALPIPQNALVARLLSRECFVDARQALTAGGILAVVTPGADTYLDAPARQRHASLRASLSSVFSFVDVAPGGDTIFWASDGRVDARPSGLAWRLAERHLALQQIGPTWLVDRLLPFHAEAYRRALATAQPLVNRDFRPFVYLLGLLESLERLAPALARAGLVLARLCWPWWAMAFGVPFGLLLLLRRRQRARLAVAVAGGVGMAMQLVLLLSFQATVGHLYHAVGALLACFMAGMAAGALAAPRLFRLPSALARACAGVAAVAAAVPLALVAVRLLPGLVAALLFAVTAVLGAAVGAVYPVAVHVCGPTASFRLYAWDLGGAAAAALVVTVAAIPVLGLLPVAALAAALAAVVAFKVV
jgi:spermidine synthase